MYKFIFLILFLPFFSSSQEFSFSVFNQANGLTQPYVYAIDQNKEGGLCISTSEGVFLYDGNDFKRLDKNAIISEPFFKSAILLEDKTLILGSNTGGIYKFRNGKLVFFHKNEKNPSPVSSFFKLENSIFGVHQNGELIQLSKDNKVRTFRLESGHLYAKSVVFKNQVAVGFESGFKLFSIIDGKIANKKTVLVNDDGVESFEVSGDVLFIGTNSSGLFTFTNKGLQKIELGKEIDRSTIKAICKDELSSIWISVYGVGVYQIKRNTSTGLYYQKTSLTPQKGLPSEFITTIFIDRETNMWFGSFGKGLIKLNSNFLVRYKLTDLGLGGYVFSVAGKDKQYFGMENGIIVLDRFMDSIYPWKFNAQLPKSKITSISLHEQKKEFYIGTDRQGLFYLKRGTQKLEKIVLSEDILSQSIRHLNLIKNHLYISTLNGLYDYNTQTQKIKHYSAADGLPHNLINSTFLKSDGKLLIATLSSGLYYLENGRIKRMKTQFGQGMLEIISFVEDRKGDIWIGTNGKGLLHMRNGEIQQIGVNQGLFSDFIYQLALDKKNTIWCGHHGGLSRINMSGRLIKKYSYKENIAMDFIVNASNSDDDNNIWFGTSEGALQFSLIQDRLNSFLVSPELVTSVGNGFVTNDGIQSILLPYTDNEVKIIFKTISLSNPDEVFYRHRLVGRDKKWSEPTQINFVEYKQLADGIYQLEVQSKIGNVEWSKTKLIAILTVERPFWKKWWVIAGCLILSIASVLVFINFRTAKLKKQKELLESKLVFRTRELEMQKNQLTIQYRETQDSIDYGVRIQKALLPEPDSLTDLIEDSFVFFQPKDKVSGDFYYFEKLEDRIIVTAADATGHGVPGAFISLIGFVTLKELIGRNDKSGPGKLLSDLDYEINKMLHQYNAVNDGKDGMDMAICEICLDTKKVRMASALRPIWIFHNGNFEKVRSSKSTVGGGMDLNNSVQKEFDVEERQLEKGDTIYMFSDGYVDQFGSKLNKKLMSKRFLDLIKTNNHLPMSEQKVIISNFVNDWKGDLDQTDDILVMGIRI